MGFVLSLFNPKAQAQENEPKGNRPDPIWFRHYESRRFFSNALSLDKAGNIYSGGSFESYFLTPDTAYQIPPGPFRETFANQLWFQKHDTAGDLQWTFHARGQARLHSLCHDDAGNAYFTGEVWSDHLVFVSANGREDSLKKPQEYSRGIYVAKVSPNGQLLASTYFSLERSDNANTMAIDSKNNIILGGNYMYRKGSEAIRSFLLLKLAPDLSPLWMMDGDTIGRSQILDLSLDGSDNIYIAGGYTEDLKIGNRHLQTGHQSQKAFVAKLSDDGKLKWLQGALTDPNEPHSQVVVNAICVDFWRRVYIAGSRFGRLYLAKLNRQGEQKWITGRQPSNRSNYSFDLLKNGSSLWVAGHGYGGSIFSSEGGDTISYLSKGSTDFFIGQWDLKGQIQKIQFGGGAGTDYATALAQGDGKVYVLGHDLGGPPVEFGQNQIDESKRKGYLRGGPVMWLACFDWE